jgi:hypothetical protein
LYALDDGRRRLLVAGFLFAVAAAAAVNAERDVIAYWPEANAAAIRVLGESGIDVVVTTPAAAKPESAPGPRILAEVEASAEAVKKARDAGYGGAAVSAKGDEKSFRQFLAAQSGFVQLVYLKPEQIGWDVAPAHAVMSSGTWPGVRRMDTGTASATERPWLDGNQNLYVTLRSLYPRRAPLLRTASPDAAARYESVEVALAEAFAAGGNVILEFPGNYREALLKGDARATAALRSLAALAAFVKQNAALPRSGNGARVGVLAGHLEETEEILNLSYRNNLAPQVLASAAAPPPPAQSLRTVVAASTPIGPEAARWLAGFAAQGGIVLTAPPAEKKPVDWWSAAGAHKLRSLEGCDVYRVGKGTLYAYREPVLDQSEFTGDLREIAGLDNPAERGLNGLDFRIWNTNTVLGTLHRNAGGKLVLMLTSYGSPINQDFLVGVRGEFTAANIQEPGGAAKPLTLMKHQGRVEFNLKGLKRLGIIVLEEKGP